MDARRDLTICGNNCLTFSFVDHGLKAINSSLLRPEFVLTKTAKLCKTQPKPELETHKY